MKIWWVTINHRHGLYTELFTDESTALCWFIGQFNENVEHWLTKFDTFEKFEANDWNSDGDEPDNELDDFNQEGNSDWAWGVEMVIPTF